MIRTSKELQRWLVEELMKPVVLVGFILGKGYDLVFGRRNVLRSKLRDQQFELEIRRELSFLFDDYPARVVPDETVKYPRPFDYVGALIAVDGLLLRLFRGRGELVAQVATRLSPTVWEDLPLVLAIIDEKLERKEFSSLMEVAIALKPRIATLLENFSTERETHLRERLSRVHDRERVVIRQWENELNRNLYR